MIRVLTFTAGVLLGAVVGWTAAGALGDLDRIHLGEDPYL